MRMRKFRMRGINLTPPTCLEWLAVELNSARTSLMSFVGVDVVFAARRNNTLGLIVRYFPQTDRAELNKIVDLYKKHAIDITSERGWNTWLKIEEDVKMIE